MSSGSSPGSRRLSTAIVTLALALTLVPGPAPASEATGSTEPRTKPYIVVLNAGRGTTQTIERLEDEVRLNAELEFRHAIDGFSAELTTPQVEELAGDPDVVRIVSDRKIEATAELAIGEEVVPTGVRRLGLSRTDPSRRNAAPVAVLDTGVDLDHPDLDVVGGANCISPFDPPEDDHGHGTHVAGTVAARADGLGVVGVAPGTPITAVKVLADDGVGTTSQLICGVDWVTKTRLDDDPANDIAVANMSLGGQGDPVQDCAVTPDPLHQAICRSTEAGVTYVVSAGNDAWDFDYPDIPDTPAAYEEVLTVTAVTDSDGRPGGTGGAPGCEPEEHDDAYASFSSFAETPEGKAHTIAAPGTCILSTVPGGGYATFSGTSMAAPHVAALVAACIEQNDVPGPCSGQSPAENIRYMREAARDATLAGRHGFTGDPTTPVPYEYYGYLATAAWSVADLEGEVGSATLSRTHVDRGTVRTARAVASKSPAEELNLDDGHLLRVASERLRHGRRVAWRGVFTNVPVNAEAVAVELRTSASRRSGVSLQVWDPEHGRWKRLTERTIGLRERTISSLLDPAFVHDGQVKVRLRYDREVSRFVACMDVVRLTYRIS